MIQAPFAVLQGKRFPHHDNRHWWFLASLNGKERTITQGINTKRMLRGEAQMTGYTHIPEELAPRVK